MRTLIEGTLNGKPALFCKEDSTACTLPDQSMIVRYHGKIRGAVSKTFVDREYIPIPKNAKVVFIQK